MKRLTLILALLLVMVCGVNRSQAQTLEKTPWPIEPHTERVEFLLLLDSINFEFMGERRVDPMLAEAMAGIDGSTTTADEVTGMLQEAYTDVDELWHRFVWLCNEEREREAVELYRDNMPIIELALSHSRVRLKFHDEILGFMAYDNLPRHEAQQLMIECFRFDFMMMGIAYMNTCDHEQYSESYEYVYYVLDTLYEETGHYEEMLSIIDKWANVRNAVDDDPKVDLLALANKAYVYNVLGDIDMELSLLVQAKEYVEELIAAGEDSETTRDWLTQINELIDSAKQERDSKAA